METKAKTTEVGVEEHGLKQYELKTSTVVFMIFCLVSAGCFGIEEMIPACGPGLTVIMLCVLPFVWGLPFGLVASELGSVRPQEGGYYKWVQEAFGEFWAFQSGWWRTISIYIDNTLYVILAGSYAAAQWDFGTVPEFILKFGMIAFFTYINIRGLHDVGVASTILSLCVLVAFACVAVCGFMNWGGGEDISFQLTAWEAEGLGDWFYFIAGGISIGMWMYSGYESLSTLAGEVANPQVIPKGTLLTIPLIMATYVLPTVAGLGSVGRWEEWGPDTVGYSTVLTEFWGPVWGAIFVVVAILAQFSIYNTYIASGSRGFFALADDHLAPPIMVKVDEKHGVPYVAVLSVGIANVVMCMLPFGLVIVLDVCLLISSYILVYLACLKLRKMIPREEYTFRIPLEGAGLYVLCIVPICLAIFAFFINGCDYYTCGMIGLLTGPILYILWRHRYGGLTKKDPVAYPENPKTRLPYGDTKRMAFLFGLMSVMNIVACVFLPWYECWGDPVDGWASGDYFDGLFESADVNVIVNTVKIMLYCLTAVTVILTIICAALSKKDKAPEETA